MHWNWSELLQHYGYAAVFIGAFFEGETVLVLGAYAVHQKWLHWLPLMGVGALASFLSDQMYYRLGAHHGQRYLQTRPALAQKFDRASSIIAKYPNLTILLMRFAVGFRTVLPLSFGIKQFPRRHYIAVNIVACVLWSVTVTTIGVKVSQFFHHHLYDSLHHHQFIWAAVLFLTVANAIIWHLWSNRKKKQPVNID